MTERNSYELPSDAASVVIVQQFKDEDAPGPPAQKAAPETKDLAPTKSQRHHHHPTPDIASITKRYSTVLPSIDRHTRKCQICHHPDRAAIEEDFILWCNPGSITDEYGVPRMALYRHANAFNLFTIRRESLRLGLDRIVERGAETFVTGDMVIRAIKAQACLTDENRWEDPPKRVIFSSDPPKESLSGDRRFSSDTNDSGEATNQCAESPAASTRIAQLAAPDHAIPETGTGNGFHQLPFTAHQSQVLIDTLPIRNET